MFKFLRLLLNILTFDDQYSPPNRDNFRQPIQLQLSQKQKIFSRFFSTFLKSIFKLEYQMLKSERHHLYHIYWSLWRQQKTCSEFIVAFLKARLNFGLFQTRDNPHTWFVSNITDSEKQIFKKSTFRGLFEKQHVNSLTLLSWKKSVSVTWKVLKMFINILTTNEKYSLLNRNNLRQQIQVQFSKKEKTFSEFISEFLKCRLNFERFRTKMTFVADVFPKLRTPKNIVNQISKKSQHVTGTKNCWNLNNPTFTIFIDHCKGNSVGKKVF